MPVTLPYPMIIHVLCEPTDHGLPSHSREIVLQVVLCIGMKWMKSHTQKYMKKLINFFFASQSVHTRSFIRTRHTHTKIWLKSEWFCLMAYMHTQTHTDLSTYASFLHMMKIPKRNKYNGIKAFSALAFLPSPELAAYWAIEPP